MSLKTSNILLSKIQNLRNILKAGIIPPKSEVEEPARFCFPNAFDKGTLLLGDTCYIWQNPCSVGLVWGNTAWENQK